MVKDEKKTDSKFHHDHMNGSCLKSGEPIVEEEHEPIPQTIFGHFRSAVTFFGRQVSKFCSE